MIRSPFFRLFFIAAILFLMTSQVFADTNEEGDMPPLKILILGGTGFIGPWEVEAAQAHGHEITLFNRGKSRPDLFPDLERLVGDRDPDKDAGLSALEGREFDVVIDNSGYYPRHVKATAELLGPNVRQYIYVSSISAYGITDVEGQDETAPVATMEDPTVEEMGPNWENYGPLKALCEKAAQDAMPGAPDDPIQIIDARDLTKWIIHMAEQNITGVFNGCGPNRVLTMREVVETAKSVTGSDATFTWLSTDFQESHPDVYFTIWTPYEGEYKGFHTFSNKRSIEAGLTFRPLSETIADLLEQFDTLPEEKRAEVMATIPVEGEAEMIEAAESR